LLNHVGITSVNALWSLPVQDIASLLYLDKSIFRSGTVNPNISPKNWKNPPFLPLLACVKFTNAVEIAPEIVSLIDSNASFTAVGIAFLIIAFIGTDNGDPVIPAISKGANWGIIVNIPNSVFSNPPLFCFKYFL